MQEQDDVERVAKQNFLSETVRGIMSILTISGSSLYRYPYRNSFEAFRGDFKRIGSDIESAMSQIRFEPNDR